MVAREAGMLAGIVVLLAALAPMTESGASKPATRKDAVLWVDAASKQAREDGSRAAPFRTIGRALAKAAAGAQVRVLGGDYPEHVEIKDGITLVGEGARPLLRGTDPTLPTLSMNGKCAVEFVRVMGGGDGIVAGLGSDVRIVNCEVVDVHGDGIHLEKHLGGSNPRTAFHIEGCLVTGTRDGIDVEGNQGVVTRSRLIRNSDDGLDYDGDADVAAIDNEIRDNFDDGIEIRLQSRTLARIQGNIISGNGEDGIEIISTPVAGKTANHVTMIGNAVRDNRRYGICGVAQGTEDVKPGLPIQRVALKDNRVEGNLKAQVTGLDETVLPVSAETTAQEAALVEAPRSVTLKPQWVAYLSGAGSAIGRAELQHNIRDGKVEKRKFNLAVKNGPPGSTWDIAVDGVVVGQITLGDGGGMDLSWATKHGSFPSHFPESAGPGSRITLGNGMSGRLRDGTDHADDALKARWTELVSVSGAGAEPAEGSVQRVNYVAYLAGPSGSGKAELYYKVTDGRTLKKQFQVTITGGRPGATWNVAVDGVVVGRVTLGSGGGMQMEWSTKYGSFPANFPKTAGAGSMVAIGDVLSGKLESRTGNLPEEEVPPPPD